MAGVLCELEVLAEICDGAELAGRLLTAEEVDRIVAAVSAALVEDAEALRRGLEYRERAAQERRQASSAAAARAWHEVGLATGAGGAYAGSQRRPGVVS